MKIAVIYHSESGNTAQMAELIAEGARLSEAVEAQTMSVDEAQRERARIFGQRVAAKALELLGG